MSRLRFWLSACLLAACCIIPASAQQMPASINSNAVVPPITKFNGVLTDAHGKPQTGVVGVTFALYQEAEGGAPLWMETQNVHTDQLGRYTVTLGSTTTQGLPLDLFASGQARWLGVQPQGQEEKARVLLVSVPYALEAKDAETLGGQPASAFMQVSAGQNPPRGGIGGSGTTNYIPRWLGSSKLGNSDIFEASSGNVGIGTTAPAVTLDVNGATDVRSTLTLFPKGSSPALAVNGSAFSVASTGLVSFASGQTFPGTGTGTITGVTAGTDLTGGGTSGSVTLNLDTTKVPLLNAANSFTGNQTINGNLTASGAIIAGSANISGAVSASAINLPVTSSSSVGVINIAGGSFLNTAGGTSNIFVGNGAGSFANTGTYDVGIGFEVLINNTSGTNDAGLGGAALLSNTTGSFNTGLGQVSLVSNTTGGYNTAAGAGSAQLNTTGTANTALGYVALTTNTVGSGNTAIGFQADVGANNLSNATAIGANATVNVSNAMVLGVPGTNVGIGTSSPTQPLVVQRDDSGSGGVAAQVQIQGASDTNKRLLLGYLADNGADDGYGTIQALHNDIVYTPLLLNADGGNVGIRTLTPNQVLTVGQGQGHVIADGYDTYSSRRWKTNIQTLPDALAKVEQLRGVSYDLKESGKHEIGVIAEEVGAVVPEIVSWEDNGKDARGVDYARLTALLIEAVKTQQAQIGKQSSELAGAVRQIKHQQTLMHKQASSVRALEAKVRATSENLQKVKDQITSRQPTLVAAK
jgi:Chaperone of endosialidase